MEYQFNFKRFLDKKSEEDILKEEQAKLEQIFSTRECFQIGYVPFMIAESAFYFSRRIISYSINSNKKENRKQTKHIQEIEKDNEEYFTKIAQFPVDIKRVREQIKEYFYDEDADRIMLELNAKNLLNRNNNNITKEMIYATIAKGFIRLFKDYNDEINTILVNKMGHTGYIEPRYLKALDKILDNYVDDSVFDKSNDFKICFATLKNKYKNAKFSYNGIEY